MPPTREALGQLSTEHSTGISSSGHQKAPPDRQGQAGADMSHDKPGMGDSTPTRRAFGCPAPTDRVGAGLSVRLSPLWGGAANGSGGGDADIENVPALTGRGSGHIVAV